DDERDTQRYQHLSQRIAGQTTQNQSLEQSAKYGDEQSSDKRGKPKIRYDLKYRDAQIRAQHEQRAVRQIRDAHEPEDQRESCREQEQQTAEGQAVQRLDDPELHG